MLSRGAQGQGHTIECGNVDEAWAGCAHIIDGTAHVGGQVRSALFCGSFASAKPLCVVAAPVR